MGRSKLPQDIKAAARPHTDTMLNVLKGIATNTDAPPAARVAAAIAILNRGWGQPHQYIDLTGEITTTKVIRTPAPATSVDTWQKQYSDAPKSKDLN